MGGGMGFEFARRMREKVRGEYRFSSLIKHKIDKRAKPILSPYLLPHSRLKKNGRNCFVIHIAGRIFFLNFFCYEVIA